MYPSTEIVAKREGSSKSATNIRNIRFYRTKKVEVFKTEFEIQLTYKYCIKPHLISKTATKESKKKPIIFTHKANNQIYQNLDFLTLLGKNLLYLHLEISRPLDNKLV